ncbi:hypothetical protein [Bacillus mycoides]|uniref:hypothetical protein n=1 Tax=Bacillus mycoides TaxID=1405 RepID=UPI001F3E3F11|nr:hypothetical protein [Bacillus mycoides]
MSIPLIGIDHLVASGIPQEFAISTLPYFDAAQVYKLWSRVQLATRRHAMDLPEEDVLEQAISSIKALVLNVKTKRERNRVGFFYSIAVNKLVDFFSL